LTGNLSRSKGNLRQSGDVRIWLADNTKNLNNQAEIPSVGYQDFVISRENFERGDGFGKGPQARRASS
jgi:hypothetical protein